MDKIRGFFNNLYLRRKILTLTSGALILLALGADFFFEQRGVYNIAMIAAAVFAGWDIAARAVASLRGKLPR